MLEGCWQLERISLIPGSSHSVRILHLHCVNLMMAAGYRPHCLPGVNLGHTCAEMVMHWLPPRSNGETSCVLFKLAQLVQRTDDMCQLPAFTVQVALHARTTNTRSYLVMSADRACRVTR